MPQKYGDSAPNWRGGLTKINRAVRELFKYDMWRSDVLARDNYTCQVCGKRGGKLEADHYPKSFIEIIVQNDIKGTKEAVVCRELWDVNGGRTLCINCHNKTKKGRLMLKYIEEVKRIEL